MVVAEGDEREKAEQTRLERRVARRRHQLIVGTQARLQNQLQIVDQRAVLHPRKAVQNRGNQLHADLDREFHDETTRMRDSPAKQSRNSRKTSVSERAKRFGAPLSK